MSTQNRLGALISLLLLGMILSLIVPLAGYEVSVIVLGSEMALRLTPTAQFGIVLAALVASAVDGIVRVRRMRIASIDARPTLFWSATFWPLPSAVALSGMVLMQLFSWWGYQVAIAAITAAGTAIAIVLQGQDDEASGTSRPAPEHLSDRDAAPDAMRAGAISLWLQLMTYAAAAVLLVALYSTRTRSLLSATGVLLIAAGLTLERLRGINTPLRRIWFYAALVGLIMGQFTWALNYHALPGRVGGGLLLLTFYVLSGLVREHLLHGLKRHVLIEYLLVCLSGLAILAGYVRLLG
jgi:hypothetical protein